MGFCFAHFAHFALTVSVVSIRSVSVLSVTKEALHRKQRQIMPRPTIECEVGHDFTDDATKFVAVARKSGGSRTDDARKTTRNVRRTAIVNRTYDMRASLRDIGLIDG